MKELPEQNNMMPLLGIFKKESWRPLEIKKQMEC
jgi:hypothetical protein